MNRDNIILIGMPASGKSTVGLILAKVLGYDFVDTDILIQNQEKLRLDEIIEKRGRDEFLDIECGVCKSLDISRTVIATGGSAVYRDSGMRHLKELGTVVYLRIDADRLRARLQDMKEREVVLRNGQSLDDLYGERSALYEMYADVIADEGELNLEQTVAEVKRLIKP